MSDLPVPPEHQETAQPKEQVSLVVHPLPAPATSLGYGALARKIRGRTTDLLAIGLMVIAGLGFGRQVLHWWREAPPPVVPGTVTAPTTWDTGKSPVQVQFGNLPLSIVRQEVHGALAEARQRLLALCAEQIQTGGVPPAAAGKSETALLSRLEKLKPQTTGPGWEVYLMEEPLSLAIGVRLGESLGTKSPQGVEQPSRRVLCWGWLIPVSEQQFSLYCMPSTAEAGGHPLAVPSPPGSQTLLSLRGAGGMELVSWSGAGPEKWMSFYDHWVRGDGKSPGLAWQSRAGGWSARTVWRGTAGPRRELSWQLSPRADGTWVGIIEIVTLSESRGTP